MDQIIERYTDIEDKLNHYSVSDLKKINREFENIVETQNVNFDLYIKVLVFSTAILLGIASIVEDNLPLLVFVLFLILELFVVAILMYRSRSKTVLNNYFRRDIVKHVLEKKQSEITPNHDNN